jgi:hypothetical protein
MSAANVRGGDHQLGRAIQDVCEIEVIVEPNVPNCLCTVEYKYCFLRRMLFFVAACIVILSQARLCWSQTTLSIPSKTQQQVASGNPPLALFIPQTSTKINVTVAICSLDIPFPSFSVQNGTGPVDPPQDSAGRELVIDGGVATWEGVGPATFYAFAPQGVTGSRFFEVGVNAGGVKYSVVTLTII